MTSLSRFARLLGLPAHQAEDALHSERAARAVLSRRSFFAAGGALAAGSAFSFGPVATTARAGSIVEVAMYPLMAAGFTCASFSYESTFSFNAHGPIQLGDRVAARDDSTVQRLGRLPIGVVTRIL